MQCPKESMFLNTLEDGDSATFLVLDQIVLYGGRLRPTVLKHYNVTSRPDNRRTNLPHVPGPTVSPEGGRPAWLRQIHRLLLHQTW